MQSEKSQVPALWEAGVALSKYKQTFAIIVIVAMIRGSEHHLTLLNYTIYAVICTTYMTSIFSIRDLLLAGKGFVIIDTKGVDSTEAPLKPNLWGSAS